MKRNRYYKTDYNESLKVKDSFINESTQNFINILYQKKDLYSRGKEQSQIDIYKKTLGNFVLKLDKAYDISNCNIDDLLDFYDICLQTKSKSSSIVPIYKDILYTILEKKYSHDPQVLLLADIVLPYKNEIRFFERLVMTILRSNNSVNYFRLIKCRNHENEKSFIHLLRFDTDNQFIQDILVEYLKHEREKYPNSYITPFFRDFGISIKDFNINSIKDFNIETLLTQLNFFININRDCECEVRKFYRFIMFTKRNNTNKILKEYGFTQNYLMNENFGKNYSYGYRSVLYNPNEVYPEFDKWAIEPNGLDNNTTMDKPNDVYYMDFTRIKDKTIRDEVKSWFWCEEKSGLNNRYRGFLYIVEFLEFRDELRLMHLEKFVEKKSKSSLNTKNLILTEEIMMYVSKYKQKVSINSLSSRLKPLKRFLKYMNKNNKVNTELAAFDYLVVKGTGARSENILPVTKENLNNLIAVLEDRATKNDLHLLYYIVFSLNLLTPLRISEILDLKRDCIVEIRKGIYALNTNYKTSSGDSRNLQITKTVKRLVETAINITSNLSEEAPIEFKNFIFIVNNQRNIYKIMPVRSYNNFINICCKEINIPTVSAQNLRKTYFTNLIENAINNNVSLFNLKALTNHSNINTTNNYYVRQNIRSYLEATNGIEIGNLEISGEISNGLKGYSEEDLVNEGCGYCRNPECNVLGTANCLMCSGFITDPSHIPQFEEGISIINNQMENNDREHDKEHLYALKRLYLKYIEELYLVKETKIDAN